MTVAKWRISEPSFVSDVDRPDFAFAPWSGHRDFAYDLIGFLQPRRIVELGTHYGCSFFAFAQAVRDHHLPTEIVAVDTWEGDPHAGSYGPEVLEFVTDVAERRFGGQSIRLLQKLFDDALEDIADESIDLLHIDGYHTKDAVLHDYRTWLPKLAPEGVVLFHDVAESSEYGSADFWTEFSETHPHLTFRHSFGLGVLFPKGARWLRELRSQGPDGWIQLYSWRSEARLRNAQIRDQAQLLEERMKVIEGMDAAVKGRDETIAAQAAAIAARDEAIAAQGEMLEERWRILEEQGQAIAAKGEEIANLKSLGLRRFLRPSRG